MAGHAALGYGIHPGHVHGRSTWPVALVHRSFAVTPHTLLAVVDLDLCAVMPDAVLMFGLFRSWMHAGFAHCMIVTCTCYHMRWRAMRFDASVNEFRCDMRFYAMLFDARVAEVTRVAKLQS